MDEVMEGRTRGVEYPVNGVEVEFPDDVIIGREALMRSDNVPANEHQLILVRNRRTHLVGTDDEIDLKKEQGGALRAFRSDRAFAFTVDEVGQVWGAEEMEVDEFLLIWAPDAGYQWVLEHEDEPDTVLVAGGLLSFGPEGVEHIVSRKDQHPDKVLVTVVTTAGTFPAEGAKRYPASTLIADVLAQAAHKLHISDTEGWIVTVAGRDVNPMLTFEQEALSGEVALEWGPREGGGGA
jgi:hypothetical protein